MWPLRVPEAVWRLSRARVCARRRRARGRSFLRLRTARGRRARAGGCQLRERFHSRAHVVGGGAGTARSDSVIRARGGRQTGGGLGSGTRAARDHTRALRGDPERDANRLLETQTVLRAEG